MLEPPRFSLLLLEPPRLPLLSPLWLLLLELLGLPGRLGYGRLLERGRLLGRSLTL